MKKCFTYLVLCFGMVLINSSCNDEVIDDYADYSSSEYEILSQNLRLPENVYSYTTEFVPTFFDHDTKPDRPIFNRREDHKATLGRVLFYDNHLSLNETVNCSSCHQQQLGFADDAALSVGFDGELTKRNSLPLGNTIGFETSYGSSDFGGQTAFFAWDESNQDIAAQSKAAILNEVEMGMDMPSVINRVKHTDYYPILFEKAYGTPEIMEHRVLEAIEEFVNSISSSNSRFDQLNKGNPFEDFEGFTVSENHGKELYNNNCASCHSIDHKFTAIARANNGLELSYADQGVGLHTGIPSDMGVFKVPFLRNIALTSPYMHDGRFATLEEVVDHYSENIAAHRNLHPNLKSPFGDDPKRFNFSDYDKRALVDYLNTLTDLDLQEDDRFSDPFKR